MQYAYCKLSLLTVTVNKRHVTHPVYFMALFEALSVLLEPLEGERTLGLEPHALHLVEALHRRHPLLEHQLYYCYRVHQVQYCW